MRSFPGKIRPTEASGTMVIEVNTNGGVYTSGKAFPYEKKAQIAMIYNQMIENNESVTARSLGERAGAGVGNNVRCKGKGKKRAPLRISVNNKQHPYPLSHYIFVSLTYITRILLT